ncbi:MAG: zeta toxin family protein [Pseudomonadales bacterium]|nr:zeta toxin family protein [Pseudomonadales bacterium]MCP5216207.1 zeta toxin family protein [Pseudomonadales bacterium]
MTLNQEEQAIETRALDYARKNKNRIAKDLTSPSKYVAEETPVSVFMAGSPGAGKTEASIELINLYRNDGPDILRIDLDELRTHFIDYNGKNAYLFQGAASILLSKIHDLALKNRQSFILDGTLTNYRIAKDNIKRSLSRDRFVQILYVYQDPILAWEFVEAREKTEGRRILKETFIEQYFQARNVVNRLKTRFQKNIAVDLLLKNNDGSNRVYKANINKIDNFVPEKYTEIELQRIL